MVETALVSEATGWLLAWLLFTLIFLTTRLETCLFHDSAFCLPSPCYQSNCTQKIVYHRMLSLALHCSPNNNIQADISYIISMRITTAPEVMFKSSAPEIKKLIKKIFKVVSKNLCSILFIYIAIV